MRLPLRIVLPAGAALAAVTLVVACRPAGTPASRVGQPAATRTATDPLPAPPASESSIGAPPVSPNRCGIFPADNVWHADVSKLPVHKDSAAFVASMGGARPVHPDFGRDFGLPVTTVKPGQAGVPVSFDEPGESDRGPYPIPPDARVEDGGDAHVIVHDPAACKVWELFDAHRQGAGWHAFSGAVFDLRSNRMRPRGWTSADAAGLSILAGLVRFDEVAAGHVDHAIRMTVSPSQHAFIWPASHQASNNPNGPPMGLRLRLKAGVDTTKLPPQARVIAEALKRYGAIVADNGSNWFFTGAQDTRWNDDQLNALKRLRGSDFEAVDESGLMVAANSYAVRT